MESHQDDYDDSNNRYNTPPVTTTTYAVADGPAAAAARYAAMTDAPALVTRFAAPAACAADWYYDQESSAHVFSDAPHNPRWSLCQPYNATDGTYSAGVCPSSSEFKRATRYRWEEDDFYVGACCGSSSTLSSLAGSQDACFYTKVPNPSIVATMLLENGGSTHVTITTQVTVVAAPLFMIWHDRDTSLLAESDARSLQAVMGITPTSGLITLGATATPTLESKSDQDDGEPDHDRTKTLVAWIIAGVALAALVTLACFLLWRRRTRKEKADAGRFTRSGKNGSSFDQSHAAIRSMELGAGASATQVGSDIEFDPVREHVEMKALRSEVNRSQSSHISVPQNPSRVA
ncbi:hypothetical protein DL764_000489 [Monosporascus ibericus]|uniref:Uncharacterized protein n=1 Tax=Monosporascus ibericus TaxID=155417 RepID=A0A4V1XCR8_9PEZI|nr:hypothetical protein DL764_000489 [Monosporascus ibericus]